MRIFHLCCCEISLKAICQKDVIMYVEMHCAILHIPKTMKTCIINFLRHSKSQKVYDIEIQFVYIYITTKIVLK